MYLSRLARTAVLAAPPLRVPTLLGAAALLLSVPATLGQSTTGINGVVTDATGATVAGAQIEAKNMDTGVISRAITTSAGTYVLTNVLPGTYAVTVRNSGFTTFTRTGVNVQVGRTATADASLKAGEVSTDIQVASAAISLQTETPQIGVTIENAVVQELPDQIGTQNRGRQIDDFLYLAPGVTGNASFSHRISGGEDFQNEVLFAGIPAVQSETQGLQGNINPPFEMVNEFEVATSIYSTQYGLGQGAVSYGFVSGTNRLHGDAFEILRNSYFDARGLVEVNPTVPVNRQNNFGFSVGGPVLLPHIYNGKDRTFWHASAEYYRYNQQPSAVLTVPTPLAKQGNFSEYAANAGVQSIIYVPQGVNCNGLAPGTPFPNNIIPANCLSPLSASLLSQVPDPTLPGLTNNLNSQLGVIPFTQDSWGFTVDHTFSPRHSIHYSEWRDSYVATLIDNNAYFNTAISGEKTEPRVGTGYFLNYTFNATPRLVITAGVGWLGEINNEINSRMGVNFGAVANGVTLPTISFGGLAPDQPTTWGVNGNGEISTINRKLGVAIQNNYLYTRGRNTYNFGFETRRAFQDDHEQNNATGGFGFSTLTTSNGVVDSTQALSENNTGNAFASYLLGQVDSTFRQQALETKLRNFSISPYINDDIKVAPRFTVNLGLRWDILVPFTVDQPQNFTYLNLNAPNPGAIGPNGPLLGAAASLGSFGPLSAGVNHANTSFNNVGPRAGFSYQIGSKTVISSGFALTFLNGGAYEFGSSKVALNYGNVLAGVVQTASNGTNVPAYGSWDAQALAAPQVTPLTPTLGNGQGVLHPFMVHGIRQPYSEQYSLTLQRQLPWNLFTNIAYVGNHGVHLPSALNPTNQLDPRFLSLGSTLGAPWNSTAGQAALASVGVPHLGGLYQPYLNFVNDFPGQTVQQALLEYPQFLSTSNGNTLNNFDENGVSIYNALQSTLQKRFTDGLSFLYSFTYSRTLSTADGGFSIFDSTAINKFNQRAEYSISNADQTFLHSFSGLYELPFGYKKPFFNGGPSFISKELIGGWQISGVAQYGSGTPNGVGANGAPLATGGNRAILVPGQPLNLNYKNYYRGLPVFNPAAFADPGRYAVGNAPREIATLRTPFNLNENFALGKKFFFGEGVQAELRMEFFNVLNREITGGPSDTNVSNNRALTGGNFGYIQGPSQGNTPRQGQAYFRVSF